MGKTIVAQIEDARLLLKPEPSDRFVYSNYYVPLQITFADRRTPILPFYTKQILLEIGVSGVVSDDRIRQILHDLAGDDLWQRNDLEGARRNWQRGQQALVEGDTESRYRERVADRGRHLRASLGRPTISAEQLTASERDITAAVPQRLRSFRDRELRVNEQPLSRRVDRPRRPTVLGTQDVEFVQGLLQPDIGFAFLDRTRITPIGFALGEHVYALGLAPGEEVLLEQKTFTKRQMTLEEQTEQEKQFDLELSSTYSTELQEGMERQRALTDSSGLNASHTGQYTSPEFFWGQFTASHTIGYTRNVTEANQQASRRSIKDNKTTSGKVSARYRTQHKTTFRLVTEQAFETTSKRTIKNPNATTPVTLHCFKVLQRLQMKQERYGVRLCWTVNVKDPATTFFAKIAVARQTVIDNAIRNLPPPPVEPAAPPQPNTTATTSRQTQFASSPITEADDWGITGDMSAQYDADIPIAQGYAWNGNLDEVQIDVFSRRPDETISRWIVGTPFLIEGNVLRVKVHIGAPSWIGGPGITFQVKANTFQDVTITEKAAEDTKYFDDLAMYRTALKQWQDIRDAVLSEAQKAADARVEQLLAQISPMNEIIAQVVERQFPASVRDEMWEIDYWQRLFDWERATFVAYPSWWSGGLIRDPLLDPSDFLNASWAKLYLPIRLGMERAALRWIFGKSANVPLVPEVERSFDEVIADIEKYREKELGAAGELEEFTETCQSVKDLHKCLAAWEEFMPTDGTHTEIVLGTTSAADAITAKEVSDAAELRAAILKGQSKSSQLADKAESLMTEAASVEVHIGSPTDQN